jgi:hypothetical protein
VWHRRAYGILEYQFIPVVTQLAAERCRSSLLVSGSFFFVTVPSASISTGAAPFVLSSLCCPWEARRAPASSSASWQGKWYRQSSSSACRF